LGLYVSLLLISLDGGTNPISIGLVRSTSAIANHISIGLVRSTLVITQPI
jgi:hypothetical protein